MKRKKEFLSSFVYSRLGGCLSNMYLARSSHNSQFLSNPTLARNDELELDIIMCTKMLLKSEYRKQMKELWEWEEKKANEMSIYTRN